MSAVSGHSRVNLSPVRSLYDWMASRIIEPEYSLRLSKCPVCPLSLSLPSRLLLALALRLAEEALALAKERKDRCGEGAALGRMGAAYVSLGQNDKFFDVTPQALAIAREIGDKRGETNALVSIGKLYSNTGQPVKAMEFYQQALPIVTATGDKQGEALALASIGVVYKGTGHPEKSLEFYQRAVSLYEDLRANLGGYTEAKTAFLASTITTYYACLSLQLKQGKHQDAFALVQKTKARSLLDLLGSGKVDLSSSLTPEEKAQEQALRQQADTLNTAMVKEGVENEIGSKKRYEALKEQLKTVESKLQTFTDTLYARHPELAQKRIAKTTTVAEIAKLLPEDTALLDFVVAAKDDIRLFVVTKSSLAVYQVARNYEALKGDATKLHDACADPRKPYLIEAQKFYKSLLHPAEAQLKGKKRLIICPDGALWDVPFAALNSKTGGSLGTRFEIVYAYYSTGVEAALKVATLPKPVAKGSILVAANPAFGSSDRFGDLKEIPGQRPIDKASRPIDSVSRGGRAIPSLPGTQREADTLHKLFPIANILTGSNAQEATVKAQAGNYRYLHFATHGFVNDGSPLLSSIVLAKPNGTTDIQEDGFLTAREIYGMTLNAELAVLSACNTARGENRTGEGVIGLTWALFVAGCPTQVVSQWAVDDASTALLMGRFYENLTVRRLGKAAALKEAESWLKKQNPKYAHPYYWAPFVLNGAWK